MISSELIEILRCPLGKTQLKIEDENLVCTNCGVVFQVRNGIPVLLIDKAELPEGVNDISELKCRKS